MSRHPPVPAASAPRWFRWLAVVALAAYAVFLANHASSSAGGSDTSGYLNSARLLAAGRLQGELRIPPEIAALPNLNRQHFMPLGADLLIAGNPHLTPTYAVGLPLHLALAAKILGWEIGVRVLELTLALAALGLMYSVARELGLDYRLAAAGAAVLAAFPVFIFTSLQPLSDTAATAWCLAAVWAALRARRDGRWALACGAALGVAVLVRATNALLLPALVVLLLPGWGRLACAALAGLPFAAWLAYYNHTLYGSAGQSGYGAIWDAFAGGLGVPTALHFLRWLGLMLPTVLLVLPLLAVVRTRSREILALALWFGAITGVYLFYEVSRQGWSSLRFILPAVPALVLAGLLPLQACPPPWRSAAAALIAVWASAASWYWTPRHHLLVIPQHELAYEETGRHARATLPSNALVACFATSGALYFYTDFPILRADQIEPADFARYAAAARGAGRPIYALLIDGFDEPLLREKMPGTWTRIGSVRATGFWELTASSSL